MPHDPHAVPDILVVEDEPAEFYLLREAFSSGPRSVHFHSVTSVAHALAFLRHEASYAQAPRPQLIVTSINLPGQSGFDLLAAVKGDPALRAIPVIILSLYDEPASSRRAALWGPIGYVIKPRELEAFFKAIHTLVAGWFT